MAAKAVTAEWPVCSTTARIVLTGGDLDEAWALVRAQFAAVERACRSELAACSGRTTTVGPLLGDLVRTALRAARDSNGHVDPTPASGGWRRIRLDGRQLTVPKGVELDISGTATAFAVDSCTRMVNDYLDVGVQVSLAGCAATEGPAPAGGWRVPLVDGSDITVDPGTAAATATGNGNGFWHSVTVLAPSCVRASVLSGAALARGWAAASWLRGLGIPARLAGPDGDVRMFGGWPR
jgi:thiamine biosynthesis lipoprotein